MKSTTLRKIRATAGTMAATATLLLTGAANASAGEVGVQDASGCTFTGGPGIAHELCINVAGVGNHVDRAQGTYSVAPPGYWCGVTFKLFGRDIYDRHWENEQRAGCGPVPYVDWYFSPTANGWFKPNSNLCVAVKPADDKPYNGEYACITIRA